MFICVQKDHKVVHIYKSFLTLFTRAMPGTPASKCNSVYMLITHCII